ncbi:hypothetical protein ACHAPT_006387 [Fusarium lateritium]
MGCKTITTVTFDYCMDKMAWNAWFKTAKSAGQEVVPVWPWEDTCATTVASEPSQEYTRYLQEIAAPGVGGSVEEGPEGVHGAAVAAETEMASSQGGGELAVESTPVEARAAGAGTQASSDLTTSQVGAPFVSDRNQRQPRGFDRDEAAATLIAQGDNVAEDLAAWVMGNGWATVLSRSIIAKLVWLRHCPPEMKEAVQAWAATCREALR